MHQVFDQPIAAVGIPGFQIPGIIIVGPSLSLAAIAELNITLAGQVLTGAQLTIANFAATVDFVDGRQSKSSNLTPQLTPIFNATGQVAATFALGLPLSLGIGLQIPALKFKKTVSINNAPSIEASANYTASTTSVGVNGNTDCVNGIGYNVDCKEMILILTNLQETNMGDSVVNAIYADLFGQYKFTLDRYTKNIASGCRR